MIFYTGAVGCTLIGGGIWLAQVSLFFDSFLGLQCPPGTLNILTGSHYCQVPFIFSTRRNLTVQCFCVSTKLKSVNPFHEKKGEFPADLEFLTLRWGCCCFVGRLFGRVPIFWLRRKTPIGSVEREREGGHNCRLVPEPRDGGEGG